MIHGIYVRNNPKVKWRLITVAVSGEVAQKAQQAALEKFQKEGFERAEAAIQSFETSFFIPETLLEIKKDSEILFN